MAHIVRIDKPKDSSKGTHGWQVRGSGKRGYHSKLFSDKSHGSRGKALVAAETYLEQYLLEHPEEAVTRPSNQPYYKGESLMGHNTSGITGVYYTKYPHRWDKERLVHYWCAFIPLGPKGQKRWHKKFNIERYGEEEAKRLAIEFRREWEKAVDQGEEALEAFFDEYHYSRLINTEFGSVERDEDYEFWANLELDISEDDPMLAGMLTD